MLLEAALNGGRTPLEHPAVALSPAVLAREGAAAVAAGAQVLHVHPRDEEGRETLASAPQAAALAALRAACPGVPVSVSTAAWIAGGPQATVAAIAAWDPVPDLASVNLHEPGAGEVCAALLARRIGVEAGLWHAEGARAFLALDPALRARCTRVLVEPTDEGPHAAVATAAEVTALLRDAGDRLPQVHHGEGPATWAVLGAAVGAGHGLRAGLEDALVLPDGRPAAGNGDLVAAAAALLQRA